MAHDQVEDEALGTMIRLFSRMVRNIKGHGRGGSSGALFGLLRERGLGPRHIPVLFSLVAFGPRPVGVLARHLGLNPATVSQLAGELAAAGFVERRPDAHDRRRMIVSLAEEHREQVERLVSERVEPLRRTLAALSPVEREGFVRGWALLVEEQERVLAERDTGARPCDAFGQEGGGGVSPGA